jgi:hypothetical protein
MFSSDGIIGRNRLALSQLADSLRESATPGWLKVRQDGDRDGGAATIHVQALIEPPRQPAAKTAARRPAGAPPCARQQPGPPRPRTRTADFGQ